MPQYRRAHFIKHNKTRAHPQEIIYFDTETRPVSIAPKQTKQVLRLGVACYYRFRPDKSSDQQEWLHFRSSKPFWSWCLGKLSTKSSVTLVAHNVGFDFMVLDGFHVLNKAGFKLETLLVSGTITIMRWSRDGQHINVLDNMNFFPMSLEALGEGIGFTKQHVDFKTVKMKDLDTYCTRDVEIMVTAWKLWIALINENDFGCFGKTLAQQALNTYRHRFMTAKILIHTFEDVTKLERESYHGGRTEAFRIGKMGKTLYTSLDVNSMYSYVMQRFEYPIRYLYKTQNMNTHTLRDILSDKFVIARVTVDITEAYLPRSIDGRLCFPIGKFDTILCGQELIDASNRGDITTVHIAAVYDQAYIFIDWVKELKALKDRFHANGNCAFEFMIKKLLNGLYGKFAQHNDTWEYYGTNMNYPEGIIIEVDAATGVKVSLRTILGVTEIATGKEEGYNSFVAISSGVTSAARWYLNQLIETAGRKNVVYCDTDSLFVNPRGLLNLKRYTHPDALGGLKIEKQGRDLIIRGLKDYSFAGDSKRKGLRKDHWVDDKGQIWQNTFRGLQGAIRAGDLGRQIITETPRTYTGKYTKGLISKNGIINPFMLREG